MRILGSFGLLFTTLFVFSLLVAIGAGRGISVDEYAPVAYFFGVFALILALTDLGGRKSSVAVRGAVLGLAIVYILAYSYGLASGERYDWYFAAPLAVAAFRLSFSLLRKPKGASVAA